MRKQITRGTRLRFVLLAFIPYLWILLAGCDVGNEPPAKPEANPFLEVVNALDSDSKYIKSVSLVGYEFSNLSIYSGSSQVFSLDEMPGGYTDINITVRYGVAFATWTVSNTFDFGNGDITTATLRGSSAEGHPDYNNYRLE